MRRLLVSICFSVSLLAEEHWAELHSGPFHVLSATGEKAAREEMAQLEQFRHALGTALGKSDLHLVWPVRVLVLKNPGPKILALGRDAYMTSNVDFTQLARLFIDQNTQRLPADVEQGLIALFSTLQVSGTHITLGTPPPPASRSRAWARMHLLNVDPAYAGRVRVMINNLEQGSELDVAYRNAFERTASQIDKQLDGYIAAGNFGTTSVSARALSPLRDFHPATADAITVQLASADLALATRSPAASKAFLALHGPEAAEGLGLLAVSEKHPAEAARLFASAIESGTKNARAFFEAGLLEPDSLKARKSFHRASELNPLWAEPLYRAALLEVDPDTKVSLLKKAAQIDPRNTQYWQALAQTETESAHFIEAQKAWGGAERAAATVEERDSIRQIRLKLQGERADHEAAERRRKAEEEAADLARVKNQSMAAIHEAEAAANQKLNPKGEAAPKAVEWWSGPDAAGKIDGTLQRFDCIGRQGRLSIAGADGKSIQLMVRNPSQLLLSGGGELTLACGVQKTQRKVVVLYNPKPDRKSGTAGEAVSIEFR